MRHLANSHAPAPGTRGTLRRRITSVAAGVGVTAVALAGVVAIQSNAEAYTGTGSGGAPAWVTGDTARKGSVLIYDGDGNQISQGADINNVGVSGLNTGWLAVSGGALGSGAIRVGAKIAAPDPTNAVVSTWATNDVPPLNFRWGTATGVPAAVAANPAFLHLNATGIAFQDVASGLTLYAGANAEYLHVLELRVADTVDVSNYWATDIEYNPMSASAPYDGLAPGAWKVVWPQVVTKTGTTTSTPTVSPSGASHAFGASLTFSTTVAPASGTITGGGSVKFFDGPTQLGATKTIGTNISGSTPLSSDAITDLGVGSHSITAQFTPADAGYSSSTSAGLSQDITGIATTATQPTSTPGSPVTSGTGVVFHTTVEPASGTLTGGTITFKDNGTPIGTKIWSGSATNGSPATVDSDSISSLSVTTHSITADFAPSTAGFAASATSSAYTFVVNAAPADTTATDLAASPATTADSATDVTLTATVSDSSSATHPAGTVNFKDGATTLGSATLANAADANKSTATFTVPKATLGLGSHSFTAEYAHTGNFADSTSSAVSYSITLAGPSNIGAPSTGAVRVGFASTCQPGSWLNAGAFTYTWSQRLNSSASWTQFATTQTSGVIPAAYAGHQVKCSVKAYSPVATSGTTAVDSGIGKVALGVASKATKAPKISGTAKVGKKLSASAGTWSPRPTSYKYVWKVGKTTVSTSSSWKPSKAYKGKYVTLTVYALRTGYLTGAATTGRVKIG